LKTIIKKMDLQTQYYYFKSVLPYKLCDDIIQYGKQHREEVALTGAFDNKKELNQKDLKNLKKKRDSNVVWMNDTWIYKEIQPYIQEANKKAAWNFDWDWSESCQFTKYSIDQYYGWHCDSWNAPYDRPNSPQEHNKIRKLSVTCSLSDPSTYEGGELEFNFNRPEYKKKDNIRKCTEILPKGSIVVFPSFVWHRVCPVTRGSRYSLVLWNLGYPFR
tara:strand:- start:458 stop:1108 length:651 start_codon:yes stop_codon:yes gene_type:complete